MPNVARPFDFRLVEAPFRMQPGLRRIPQGQRQLTPARPGSRHLREKMAVLSLHAAEALVAEAGFDPLPALAAIAEESAHDADPAFVFASARDCAAPRLGWALCDGVPAGDGDAAIGALLARLPPASRPTALLCLAFDEDFAVIDGGTAVIPWLAVCLPSRWAPAEKVGRHFAAVHAPVADGSRLIDAAGHLARLVAGPDRWERFVWTVSADPRLHQHPARGGAAWPDGDDAEAVIAAASLRHEHQTFIPVPATGQAVFTIRVDSEPLDRALRTGDDARRLREAIASMSPAVLDYRGLAPVHGRLLRALDRRAAELPAAA